jgi:hypothetical protein
MNRLDASLSRGGGGRRAVAQCRHERLAAVSLAFCRLAVGVARACAAARPAKPARDGDLHRCTDARGKVTWQDDACPQAARTSARDGPARIDPPKRAVRRRPRRRRPPRASRPPPQRS